MIQRTGATMSQALLNALASAVTDLCREAATSGARYNRRTFQAHSEAIQTLVIQETEKASRDAAHPQTAQAIAAQAIGPASTGVPRSLDGRLPAAEPDDARSHSADGIRSNGLRPKR